MRGLCAVAAAAAISLFGATSSFAVPPAATASRACPAFSYHERAAAVTFRFYALRATHVSCASVKHVIEAYFHGPRQPAGSVPTDGYLVRGWRFYIGDRQVSGVRRGARFSGRYA